MSRLREDEPKGMSAQRARGRSITPVPMQDDYDRYHFSPGFEAGGFLFISGQIGLDEFGEAPTDPAEQARIAFAGIGAVLAAGGLAYEDVVSITSHHVGDVAGIFEWFPDVKDSFLGPPYPAWTALGVSGLAIPGLVVEISAIARTQG